MELSALRGNERIKEQLSQQERGRGLSHAYILSGPAGSGKHTLAWLLAAGMLCTSKGEKPCGRCASCLKVLRKIHPDVSVVSGPGEGKPIAVDQVRALRSDAYIRPNEGRRKVYLLEEADRMNPSAQNAMLKLLEDGPRYASFLLIAGNVGGLLQTVRSRCEELALLPAEAPAEHAGGGESLAQVRELADALERAGELELLEASMAFAGKRSREELFLLLDALEVELGARMVQRGGRRLLRAIELTRELRGAARLNVNANQLSGWLCAGMFEAL